MKTKQNLTPIIYVRYKPTTFKGKKMIILTEGNTEIIFRSCQTIAPANQVSTGHKLKQVDIENTSELLPAAQTITMHWV